MAPRLPKQASQGSHVNFCRRISPKSTSRQQKNLHGWRNVQTSRTKGYPCKLLFLCDLPLDTHSTPGNKLKKFTWVGFSVQKQATHVNLYYSKQPYLGEGWVVRFGYNHLFSQGGPQVKNRVHFNGVSLLEPTGTPKKFTWIRYCLHSFSVPYSWGSPLQHDCGLRNGLEWAWNETWSQVLPWESSRIEVL